jgi:hypothetical protein
VDLRRGRGRRGPRDPRLTPSTPQEVHEEAQAAFERRIEEEIGPGFSWNDDLVAEEDSYPIEFVSDLVDEVAERYLRDVPSDVATLLALGPSAVTQRKVGELPLEVQKAGQTVTRIGYESYAIERERVPGADAPIPTLTEILREGQRANSASWFTIVLNLCGNGAAGEPVEPRGGQLPGLLGLLPGFGVPTRCGIARQWAHAATQQTPGLSRRLSEDDLIRCWKFGFYAGGCLRALPDGAQLGDEVEMGPRLSREDTQPVSNIDVPCPICGKVFRTRRQMEGHQRTRH